MNYKDLELKSYIQDALKELNFVKLTEVQEAVIPNALNGESLIVQSHTGTGKSHSFLVPIFQKLDEDLNEVQAVITAPSRELASQLYEVARQIADHSDKEISVVNYIGGTDKERQIEKLSTEQPQIVIGTPGRIFDLMQENALWVQTASMMVVDEADMTMDLGFLSLVDEIASRLPKDLQMMAFSATIPQNLEVFLRKYMHAPKIIKIASEHVIAPTIKNRLIRVGSRDRKEIVYELLTIGHPFLALVFCNTQEAVDETVTYLQGKGLKVATIHGGIQARERRRLMRQIRQLDFQYVVATDLAARGIDIDGVSMVINMEIPTDLDFFVHRVGRTGRSGLEGVAYTLVGPDEEDEIAKLEKLGIEFIPYRLTRKGLEEDTRGDRTSRRKIEEENPEVTRIINQAKAKKVKPGYKRKMREDIKQARRQKSRQDRRRKNRQNKKKR